MTLPGGRLARYAPWAALIALAAWLFGPALAGRGVFFQRDAAVYWLPQVESLLRVLSQGALPVWNPYFEVGLPMLADPGYQIFYPPQWASLLLLPTTLYAWFAAGHALLGATGAFALGRRWGLDRLSSFGMAAIWLAGGPLLSLVSNNPQFASAAWIPWVLTALEHLLASPALPAAALLGAASALQLLAGSGDLTLITAQLGALRTALWYLRAPAPSARKRTTLLLAAAGGFALSLSACLWMPTLAVIRSGGRAQMSRSANAYWSVHPASLVDLFVPQAVSDLPLSATARELLFEGREPFLPSLYLGAASLLVVPLGLRATRLRGLLLLGAFVALVGTALGRHAFLHGWVLRLPAASLFRYPSKYMIPAALLWAGLVGFGLRVFQEDWNTLTRRLATTVAAVGLFGAAGLAFAVRAIVTHPEALAGVAVDVGGAVAGLAVRGHRTSGFLALGGVLLLVRSMRARVAAGLTAAMVGLLVVDVVLAAHGLNPLAPVELMRHRPALLTSVATRPDGFPSRVLTLVDPGAELNRRVVRGPVDWDREWSWMLGLVDQLAPPTAARWGLGGGYDGDFTGLGPPSLSAFSGVIRHPRVGRLGRVLLRVGGIDYVVSLDREVFGLEEMRAVPSVYDAPVRLFRVPDPVARVYLAGARYVPNEPRAWERLAAPDFDPAGEVVMVGPEEASTGRPLGRLTVLARRPDRVEVEVDALAAGHVVLTEMKAPGWMATIDGAPIAVATANLLFCAVPVAAGRHRVIFEYRAPASRAGLTVTVVALAALGAVLWRLSPVPLGGARTA